MKNNSIGPFTLVSSLVILKDCESVGTYVANMWI